MNSIIDYVKWRGDLSFEASPFNRIDNLILTQLAYALWDGVLSDSFEEQRTLYDAVDAFFAEGNDDAQKDHGYFASSNLLLLMPLVGISKRFRDVKICGYVNQVEEAVEKQFSAVTFLLDDETAYVAYRGTDSTMVGWKEDFNMSFMYTVPSQNMAISYLHDAIIHLPHMHMYVGGHSKGGNLAVYAAAFLPSVIQSRVLQVFNNDGPGLMSTVVEMDGYQRMKDRIETFVPQSSVFGMILEHEEEYRVVHSNQVSVFQHNAFSWDVLGVDFVYMENVHKSSEALNKAFRDWVSDLSYEDKQKFFDVIFDVINEAGITTTADLRKARLKSSYALLKTYRELSAEDKKLINEGLTYFFKSIGEGMGLPNIPFLNNEEK